MNIITKTSDTPAILGEGITTFITKYGTEIVVWVDIQNHTIYLYNGSNNDAFYTRATVTNLVNRLDEEGALDEVIIHYPSIIIPTKSRGHFLVAFKHHIVKWNIDFSHIDYSLANITDSGIHIRFNDGKCDPKGRLWIGTTHTFDKPNSATLYRMDLDEKRNYKLTPIINGVSISNGIAWSLDGQYMYYIDTPTRSIAVYNYDLETGNIICVNNGINYGTNNPTPFCVIDLSEEPGVPDGMNIDNRGYLWIAFWDGAQVICIDPIKSTVISRINLSVSRPTNVAISKLHPGRLYVTTAHTKYEPNSGQMQVINTGESFLSGGSHPFQSE